MKPSRAYGGKPSILCGDILKAMKEAGKPLSASEVARITGFPESRVASSIEHLVKQGSVQGRGSFSITRQGELRLRSLKRPLSLEKDHISHKLE